jgi:hypothetical protein
VPLTRVTTVATRPTTSVQKKAFGSQATQYTGAKKQAATKKWQQLLTPTLLLLEGASKHCVGVCVPQSQQSAARLKARQCRVKAYMYTAVIRHRMEYLAGHQGIRQCIQVVTVQDVTKGNLMNAQRSLIHSHTSRGSNARRAETSDRGSHTRSHIQVKRIQAHASPRREQLTTKLNAITLVCCQLQLPTQPS